MTGRLGRLLWGLDETIVVVYLFVIAFGAVRPFEILPITAFMALLTALWLRHALQS
jgi:hypothetical protein